MVQKDFFIGRFRKDDNPRRQFGLPSRGNANFAWVQHFIYHLVPQGMAGFVLIRFWFGENRNWRA